VQDHVSELLSPYADGQVSPAERQAVEAHLVDCADCRAELASLRALKGALARLPRRGVPRSFALGPRAVRPAALSGTLGGFARAAASIAAALAVVALAADLAFQGLPRQSSSAAASLETAPPAAAAQPALAPAASVAPPARAAAKPAPAAAEAPAPASQPRGAAPAGAAAQAPAVGAQAPGAASQPAGAAAAGGATAQAPPSPASRVAQPAFAPAGASAAEAPHSPVAAAPSPREGPSPVNVPRLAGELLVLLVALGIAVRSLRWWRR
jgi:putative zinc finger protein